MAWHLGYPLAQTLFTSVYMESILMPQPDTLEEAHFIRNPNSNSNSTRTPASPMHDILRAFCLGLLKTCGLVNEKIINEHYYEVILLFSLSSYPACSLHFADLTSYSHFFRRRTS